MHRRVQKENKLKLHKKKIMGLLQKKRGTPTKSASLQGLVINVLDFKFSDIHNTKVTKIPLKCTTNRLLFPYILSVQNHMLHSDNIYTETKHYTKQINRYANSNITNKPFSKEIHKSNSNQHKYSSTEFSALKGIQIYADI